MTPQANFRFVFYSYLSDMKLYEPEPTVNTAYPFSIFRKDTPFLPFILRPLSVTSFGSEAGTYTVAVLPTGTSISRTKALLLLFQFIDAFPLDVRVE